MFNKQLYLNNLLKNNNIPKDKLDEIDTELRIIDMILSPSTPELWLNPNINSFFDFDNSTYLKDVKIKNYKHLGKIKFPITQ